MMRFRMKFDKKGIPAFVLILIMMFQGNQNMMEETAVVDSTAPLTLAIVDEALNEMMSDLTLLDEVPIINASEMPNPINVMVAGDTSQINAVQFLLDDVELRLDDVPPFALADEETGWRLPEAGEHTITAIPFSDIENESAAVGEPLIITFSVTKEDASSDKETP